MHYVAFFGVTIKLVQLACMRKQMLSPQSTGDALISVQLRIARSHNLSLTRFVDLTFAPAQKHCWKQLLVIIDVMNDALSIEPPSMETVVAKS